MKQNVGFDWKNNLTLLTDFYELTMSNGFFVNGLKDRIAYYDMFYRHNPDNGGFAIMAGVDQLINYLSNLHFSEEDVAYLRSTGLFEEPFLNYLRTFRFSCDVWALPEGTPIFPGEPIITVRGPVIETQLIETMVLAAHQPPKLDCYKSQSHLPCCTGTSHYGVWLSSCAGH